MIEKIRDKSIKGPVTQITDYNYIAEKESRNKLDYRLIYKEVSVYDSKKRLTEKTCYEGDGDFFQKETFLYNDKGWLIEERAISVEQPKDSKLTYKYNSKGQLIERNLFYSNQLIKTVYYEYNEYGLLEFKHGIDDFDVPYKISYEYDQDGNFVQEHIPQSYAFSGRFNYDESGRVIEKFSIKEGKRIKDYFSYDEKGFIFESRTFELRQVDSDEWIEEIYGRQTYKYDDRGNLIECCRYDSSLMETSKDNFIYAYDEYGNWTRMLEFINCQLNKVSERKIDYAKCIRNE